MENSNSGMQGFAAQNDLSGKNDMKNYTDITETFLRAIERRRKRICSQILNGERTQLSGSSATKWRTKRKIKEAYRNGKN